MIQAQRVELTNSAWVILDWTVSAGTYRQTASINLTRSHSATVDLAGQPWAEGTIVTPTWSWRPTSGASRPRRPNRCNSP